MSKMIEFMPDGLGRVGKRSYHYTRIEMPRGELNLSQTKNIFYLQDFYDLLNEEGEITIWQKGGPIEPQITTYRKIYTMGPLCGALSYNENGESKFMFYDGNFSNVAGIDIFGNNLYSNEYGPNGEILYSTNYLDRSFGCYLYDEDLGSYIEEITGAKSPFSNLSYSISKDLPTFKKISIIARATAKSSGPLIDWIWIWLPLGSWDCFDSEGGIDLSCLFWDGGIDTGGGGGGEGDPRCTRVPANTCGSPGCSEETDCSMICRNLRDCKRCCENQVMFCCRCRCSNPDSIECKNWCNPELTACITNCEITFGE